MKPIKIKRSHEGKLHRALKIPKNEPIPAEELEKKPDDSREMSEMKTFARNARHWKHK